MTLAIDFGTSNTVVARWNRVTQQAETAPVAGRYYIDGEDALVMITDYETMSSLERFWFQTPNLRLRASTVKLFGGLNKATFCAASPRRRSGEGNLCHPRY